MPWEWLVSVMCEEFPGLTPSQALAEPFPLLLNIIELRGYARAKQAYERADDPFDPKQLPQTDLVKEVREIRKELNRRRLERDGMQRG